MLTDYIIFTISLTTLALIWRALLLEHPTFAKRVRTLPMVGGSLYCGFCAPLWLSFFAVLIYNPIDIHTSSIVRFAAGALTVGAGVLFFRNLIAILMEGNGVLTELHRSKHQ